VVVESLMMLTLRKIWSQLPLRFGFGGFGHWCCGDFGDEMLMLLEIAVVMWRLQSLDVVECPKTLTLGGFAAAIVVAKNCGCYCGCDMVLETSKT